MKKASKVSPQTPWLKAVEEYLAASGNSGCGPQTLCSFKYCLMSWSHALGNLPVGSVTAQQLNGHVHRPDRSPKTNLLVYTVYRRFFAWLKCNGYLRADLPTAMDYVSRPVRIQRQVSAVLTVATARQSLQALVMHGTVPDALGFALGLFSGLRMGELDLFEMSDIVPGEQLMVPAHKCMTGKCRIMPMLPVLHTWLAPFYGREGRLFDRHNSLHRIVRLLRQQGLAWQRIALRHSFVAYRLAATNDQLQTSRECGISPAIMANHHLQLVTAAQAADYFALTPEACGITDWPKRVQALFALQRRASSRKPRLHPASRN